MRLKNLKTKIFLDGGDPQETKEIIKLLGFLDGQTTNPTLIAKNPEVRARLASGKKFSEKEIWRFYRAVVAQLSRLIPDGSVSIEVYADAHTSSSDMMRQGRQLFSWIPNAHIKLPITREGLAAAKKAVSEGMRVNMTLCFSQEQAAAVYAATAGARKGNVFISPFIGRLDDQGKNGMDLIANTIKMYKRGDGHVEVLTASVRNMSHFMYALRLKTDIITAPFTLLKEWAQKNMSLSDRQFIYDPSGLSPIPYQKLKLNNRWDTYDIHHTLTDNGIERFANDWNALI